jgi:O-acetyl-ADP-ribose deacetylase (regulator of RNase III)
MTGCWVPMHLCIDNAIHTYAGVQLRETCARLMEEQGETEPTGAAKVTPAYNLPGTWVVHTVGPIVHAGLVTARKREELASCYLSCLDAAAGVGAHSIAFCCISTGVFGYPQDAAASLAVETVRVWLDEHPEAEMIVVFNVFLERDEQLYRNLLGL